jgi:hypothetical protein
MAAYDSADCSFSDLLLGAFDTFQEVFDVIAVDHLTFMIWNQQQATLQGVLIVHLTVIYASMGKTLVRLMKSIYLTGPHIQYVYRPCSSSL